MGLIKEPKGIDFKINSKPLTKKDQEALSKFIAEDKAKTLKKGASKISDLRSRGKKKTIA